MATLGNPKNTIEVLQKYNFNFQKKFGQNFLINTGILEDIIDAAEITKDDLVKVALKAGIKKSEAEKCIEQVKNAGLKWDSFAEKAGLSLRNAERIKTFFDLGL